MYRARIDDQSATGLPSAFLFGAIWLLCPHMTSCDGSIYALVYILHSTSMGKALSDCTSIIFNLHLDNKCLWRRSDSKWKHHISELMLLYGYLRKGTGSVSVLG
jgi:hypothetical protein